MKSRSYLSALAGLLLFLAVMMAAATGRAEVHAHSTHSDAEWNELHVAHLPTDAEAHITSETAHVHEGEFHSDNEGETVHS